MAEGEQRGGPPLLVLGIVLLLVGGFVGLEFLPSNADVDPRRDFLCAYQSFAGDAVPGLPGPAESLAVELCGTRSEVPLVNGEFNLKCVPCPREATQCELALEFRHGQSVRRFVAPNAQESCGIATVGVDTLLSLRDDGSIEIEHRP